MPLFFGLLFSFILLSCGGGGGGGATQNNTPNSDTITLKGRVVDGEISGATLFLDLDLDGELSNGEPSALSDDEGLYTLVLDQTTLRHANYLNHKALVVAFGGFDIRAKTSFDQKLKATVDGNTTLHITPITTLIATMVELSSTLEDAKQSVAHAYNISYERLTLDPMEALNKGDKELFSVSMQIHQKAKLIRQNALDTTQSYIEIAKTLQSKTSLSVDGICQNQEIGDEIFALLEKSIAAQIVQIEPSNLQESLIERSLTIDSLSVQLALALKRCQKDIGVLVENNSSLEYQILAKILAPYGYTNPQTIQSLLAQLSIDSTLTPQKLLSLLENNSEFKDLVGALQNPTVTPSNPTDTPLATATHSDLVVKIKRTSEWNSGFCEEVEIYNPQAQPKLWNVTLDVKGDIYTLWNAHYTFDSTTQRLNAWGVEFNRAIGAKGIVSFGYCANSASASSSTPSNDAVTSYSSEHLQLSQKIQSHWGSGYCSDVIITNQSPTDKLWSVSFEAQGKVNDLWNATYTQDPTTLTIQAKGVEFNRVVKAYDSVTIGYCAALEEGVASDSPTNPPTQPNTALSDEQSLLEDTQMVTFESIKALNSVATNITSNLYLPILGKNGSNIVWSSSDSQTLLSSGGIKRPTYNEGDKAIRLEATLSKGSATQKLFFDLTVKALPQSVALDSSKYTQALDLSMSFYEAQKASGPFERAVWRKPIASGDGSDVGVDLDGGWFDAGDHVKFNLPMSYSATMLNWSMIDNPHTYSDLDYAHKQVKYALDYLARSYDEGKQGDASDDRVYYQVGNGNADHGFWGPPQDLTMPRPTSICNATQGGCAAVSGSMAAALASGYMLFRESDSTFANGLLLKAKEIYAFAKTYPSDNAYRDASPFYQLFDDNKDQIAWAAIWLYQATHEQSYLDDAKRFIANKSPVGWVQSWDNVTAGVYLLLAQITQESQYRNAMEQHIEHWITSVPASPAGLRVISQWGSLRYASTQAFVAAKYASLLSDESKKRDYLAFAQSQIDYILGDNPLNFSYLIGFGSNYPINPHHRASHESLTHSIDSPTINTHILVGALVGGPLSTNDYDYKDERTNYISNEVATDYNAGLSAALAQLIAMGQ